MTHPLKHIRYVVYRDTNHQKQVAIWQDTPIHPTYIQEHHIPIADFCVGGYIGAENGQWLIYEHFPIAEKGKDVQEFNKRLVMTAFRRLPEYTDEILKTALI